MKIFETYFVRFGNSAHFSQILASRFKKIFDLLLVFGPCVYLTILFFIHDSYESFVKHLADQWHGLFNCFSVIPRFIIIFAFALGRGFCRCGLLYDRKSEQGIFRACRAKSALYSYIGPIVYIILFSRKKEKMLQHRIQSMKHHCRVHRP